ncbi:MAG: hypothetical protein LBD51_10250 [Bifidobacteriaceae bacterium]|nr:hypothetical protein [Bifidobacteriaceae bacterium]
MTSQDPRQGRDEEPDFDRRWQELAGELGQALPPDLQNWAQGGAGPPGPDSAGGAPRQPGGPGPQGRADGAAGPGRGGRGHVVWGADPEALGQGQGAASPPPPGPRDWAPPEADEHFEPPEPPPVFTGHPLVALGWIAFLGGLAAVFAWAILGAVRMPTSWARLGLLAMVAGAAVLISRLPRRGGPEAPDQADEDLYDP